MSSSPSASDYNPFERVRTNPNKVCNPKRSIDSCLETVIVSTLWESPAAVAATLIKEECGQVKKLKIKNPPEWLKTEDVNSVQSSTILGNLTMSTLWESTAATLIEEEIAQVKKLEIKNPPEWVKTEDGNKVLSSNILEDLTMIPLPQESPAADAATLIKEEIAPVKKLEIKNPPECLKPEDVKTVQSPTILKEDLTISSDSEDELIKPKVQEKKKTILIDPLPGKSSNKKNCEYVYVKGPKKGSQCVNFTSKNSNSCAHHKKPTDTNQQVEIKTKTTSNLEDKIKIMDAKINLLTNLVTKMINEKPIAKTKLSSLTKQELYKVEKVESNGYCVISDNEGNKQQFKVPASFLESMTPQANYIRYDKTLKKHFWQC